MNLAGYELDEIIYSVGETVVASAVSSTGDKVVLKYQNTQYPSVDLNARWLHEYEVLSSIDSEWVLKARGIERINNGLMLVLENFSYVSLAELVADGSRCLASRIQLAIQMCCALGDVHKNHLVHNDISPKNILVDLKQSKIKLCDFGLSTRLTRELPHPKRHHLQGTLDYVSPEQTGRTNLDVDYRSDLYSLGVTLYELFSGRKPFVFDDSLALLHAHIARLPESPITFNPEIPPVLAKIVLRLLAKFPGDRYQSSYGLQRDLKKCLAEMETTGFVQTFALGQWDIPERFCVSQKLYGREREQQVILSAFERANSGRSELLLISGYSGIGKTALVNELHIPIVAQRGIFVRGKCEQYSRNQPYSVLIQAFQPLMLQLLNEGEEKLRYWQFMLRCALGNNIEVITDIIPDLKLVIGEPPPLQILPAAEAEKRFHLAFTCFVNALSCSGHPLVVFLDDLQWADISTLKLIEQQVQYEDERALLIVAAYRDNEVNSGHPLLNSLRKIEQLQGVVHRIKLSNLKGKQVTQLVSDTLKCSEEDAQPLAALCIEKTLGNPFFLNQFLHALHDQGELFYNYDSGAWQWSVLHIQQRGMTDNVIELMLEKIRTLDDETQRILSIAAYTGNEFDIRLLARVSQDNNTVQTEEEINDDILITATTLWPALKAGLIIPLGEHYKFSASPEKLRQARFRFLHDRVQQAAYELTSEADRPMIQLRTGRTLLALCSQAELEERLFDVLGLLNKVTTLIDAEAERSLLLDLNIRGGVKAKAAAAYQTAVLLLRKAASLLGNKAWIDVPDKAVMLYKELAEAEYLCGNFENAEKLYREQIELAPSGVAKATLSLVQADQYHIQGRFDESIPVLLYTLSLIGEEFPASEEAAGAVLNTEFAVTEEMLLSRPRESLLNGVEMQQVEHLLQMRVYNALSFATYQTGRIQSFLLNACKMVQCTLNHGQCDLSCIGYVAYVTTLSAMGKPYPVCYQMGNLAMKLAEQRENTYFRLTIYQYFSAFYQHWGEPIENSFPYLDKGMEWGLEGTNLLSAGYCALLGAVNKFAKGIPLEELKETVNQGLRFLRKTWQVNTENYLLYGVLQPLLALQGKTVSANSFDSETVDHTGFFDGDYETPSIDLALYIWSMLRHSYLLEDEALQARCVPQLHVVGLCLPDGPAMVESNFYVALILLQQLEQAYFNNESAEETSGEINSVEVDTGEYSSKVLHEDERYLALQTHIQKFKQWSEHCPENFLHKYLILAAEFARLNGDADAAMDFFSRAIEEAQKSGFLQYMALANERYAHYWKSKRQPQIAAGFIQEAYYYYQHWGADVKSAALRESWSLVSFSLGDRRFSPTTQTVTYKKMSEHSELLDLNSLLKANQLLAEELQLDSLLHKMMAVLLENAGAEFGSIILLDEGELVVEIMGKINSNTCDVDSERLSRPIAELCEGDYPALPDSLIRHVQQAQETIILNRPGEDSRFSYNTYLQQRQPKSVMCVPILAQTKLCAVVYLENNLLESAFTPTHKKTLEMISSQAAISLVNARLYDNLEYRVMQRTEELRLMTMKDGLTQIANRRSFDERLDQEWRRAARNGHPLSLLMIDIDHFKQYNDFYGHLQGDTCIKAVADALERSANRVTDFVARYGGEEFSVLMSETDSFTARKVAIACLESVANLAMAHERSDISKHVTISVGIHTTLVLPGEEPESLIGNADQALYQAKQLGRNRVHVYKV